ncbi:inositol monophosphatase family protein [Paracidobacterium acidisoli]|uniref:inositol monophosphatase family protein n=1 Tax=Paracidobacterium acidisoli TaxID=2303751 RepID=UPI002079C397|nr:inositol monophosphatase family protein [Paracidobacterium acidisoli]
MSRSNIPQELPFAAPASEIALEAGALLREYFRRGVATEYKGDVDLVTEADRASEKQIVERLHAAFPTHGIYGEEGTREGLDREYRWYIDPLDGTTNFAHSFPVFCVSMGLEHRPAGLAADQDGELVAGVIYDPMRDELFTAEKGRGAWRNGQPIHVSPVKTLSEALLATGFPSRKRHSSPNIHFYQECTLRSHGVRRAGSAALDLAYTACGRLEGFWEFNLNPWDTAAGVLLVTEAGGTVTRFDGSPFLLDSEEILATNGALRDEIVGLFSDMFAGRNLLPIPTPAEYAAARAQQTQP